MELLPAIFIIVISFELLFIFAKLFHVAIFRQVPYQNTPK